MKKTTKNNNLIYDIGLHKGEDTEFYLKKGFDVIAFEANPHLVNENVNKFEKQIKNGQLVIENGAIANNNESGHIQFYRNLDKDIWGTIDTEWVERNKKKSTQSEILNVPIINFSKCIREHGMPYYMKIDIEGADMLCLETLLDFNVVPSFISIESSKTSYIDIIQEINLLEQLGYNKFMAIQQDRMDNTKLPSVINEGHIIEHNFSKYASGLFGKDLPKQWKNKDQILKEYERIFKQYKSYGDNSFWEINKYARFIKNKVAKILKTPLPGWYDTHAMHSSERTRL